MTKNKPYISNSFLRIVNYRDLYPERMFKKISTLLQGIDKISTLKMISNMYLKLVNKPFYNPEYDGDEQNIDVLRFCLSWRNKKLLQDILIRYFKFIKGQPNYMITSYCGVTRLSVVYLLRELMSIKELELNKDIALIEKNVFRAILQTNYINYEHEHIPLDIKEQSKELYCATILLSRFRNLDMEEDDYSKEYVRQVVKCMSFFEFAQSNETLSCLLPIFYKEYGIKTWEQYPKAFLSVLALSQFSESLIDFSNLKTDDQLCCKNAIKNVSITLEKPLRKKGNEDYRIFRNRPIIRLNDNEYFICHVGFTIERIYNSLYFQFLDYYKSSGGKDKKFLQYFTTIFSEDFLLSRTMKKITSEGYDVSLNDADCKSINKKVSSPPDFFIRKDNAVISVEYKDLKMKAWIKEYGSYEDYIDFFFKHLVHDDKKPIGVGQILTQVERIKQGNFVWDKYCPNQAVIYPMIVVADHRHTLGGLKNFLNIKMKEQAISRGISMDNVKPILLIDVATLMVYSENFIKDGFIPYFEDYYEKTAFDETSLEIGNLLSNGTASFADYMNCQECYGMHNWEVDFIECLKRTED